MSTLTNARVTRAPVTHVPEPSARRSSSPSTNVEVWSSPLVTESQRDFINAELVDLGAARLRGTHATETVARKAIRVALRDAGYEAADARALAVELVQDSRLV